MDNSVLERLNLPQSRLDLFGGTKESLKNWFEALGNTEDEETKLLRIILKLEEAFGAGMEAGMESVLRKLNHGGDNA